MAGRNRATTNDANSGFRPKNPSPPNGNACSSLNDLFESQGALRDQLHEAATAAHDALDKVASQRERLSVLLSRHESRINAAGVAIPKEIPEQARKAVADYSAQYDQLRRTLSDLTTNAALSLQNGYRSLEENSRYVTIMLFGRTRAGKSTTMEALIGGSGATIGKGRQHTTREVSAYYLPRTQNGDAPDGPALRVVDTPGIEGFDGDALAAMAEAYVERSDHIFFLLTDDKASTGELNRFGLIKTFGKGVTVLLNVKRTDGDLYELAHNPAEIFDSDLEGHERRISRYLSSAFHMPAPDVLPYHARAAWIAKASPAPAALEGLDRMLLWRNSRITRVEQRIVSYIRNEALPSRMRAPRDLLDSHIYSLKSALRPFASQFKGTTQVFGQMSAHLTAGAERARRKATFRLEAFRSCFQAADDALPGLVDDVLAAGGGGARLTKRWKQHLRDYGVQDAMDDFIRAGTRDFEDEIHEAVATAALDFELGSMEGLDSLVEEYRAEERTADQGRYLRVGTRVAAGTAAAALTHWAVVNFWNPSGWLAAAGAVAASAVGVAAQHGAGKAADEWKQASKRELLRRRSELLSELRAGLWKDFRFGRQACVNWLDKTVAAFRDTTRQSIRPLERSAQRLWRDTVKCLDDLDALARDVDLGLIHDLLARFVPEVGAGTVIVHRVTREVGFAAKILVSAPDRLNPVTACIGRAASRVRRLRSALGGERVHFVDAREDMRMQVLQALGARELTREHVFIQQIGTRTTARVNGKGLAGPRGQNVRLAEALLGMRIRIGG